MDIRALRAFVEVVRQGGFSQAAKTIFATQSAISKAVKQLEEETGTPLLDRLGHKSRLTAAGEIVYQRALKILAERDNLLAELEELRGMKRGALRLGLPPVGSAPLFAPLFAAYRSRYPDIDIHLVEHGAERLEELLLSGEVDLIASLLPVSNAFGWKEVRKEPLVVLLSENNALAERSSVKLRDLENLPFILFQAGFALNRVILDACQRQGMVPAISAQSSQLDFIVELAAAGMGAAFLPRMIAEQRPHPRVRSVLLNEPGTDFHIAMVWRHDVYISQAAQAWLDLCDSGTGRGSA
jgi:Transcriptional regulator